MSMIEQASKRLEQLGQAGFSVPTSVSRLRVVDDAGVQVERRRVVVPARSLSDAATADDLSSANDAPAHFSPALYPTPTVKPAVAAPQGVAAVADSLPVAVHPGAIATPPTPAAEAAHRMAAVSDPVSEHSVFFAASAEAEKALLAEPSLLAGLSATPLPLPVPVPPMPPAQPAPLLEVQAPSAFVPAASVIAAAPILAPTPVPATAFMESAAPLKAAVPPALAAGMAVDTLAGQRAEPSTRVSFDLERLRGVGYLVPDQVRSEMAEQFRHLKRPLLKNARAKTGSSGLCSSHIMITSALPGEGKTFSSINLAMSMAMEVDTAVLLIDADVVRPSVFNRLGINIKPPGLLDLLTRDDLPLHEALVSTNVPKLTLMASGERNQRSTELLASTAMDRLLARLAAEYPDHVVIFDAPPLLLTNESPVLATKVGQVVVVVEACKTRRTVIQQAFAALKNCPVVHSVLNKCDESTEGRRYGYYYG
jgi:protein-tyrosine kinase